MTLVQLLRLIGRYAPAMFVCALVAAFVTFYGTRNSPKEYESFTLINTGLVTGYNLENSQGGRVDFGYTNNEIENILSLFRSREIQTDLLLRLLAQGLLLERPDPEVLSPRAFTALQELIPAGTRRALIVPNDTAQTILRLRQQLEAHGKNPVKDLLESDNPLFGLEHLRELVAKREGSTDLIRLAYTTTDPGLCRNMLKGLTEIAIFRHRSIKEGQSTSVLDFFEQATRESAAALNGKEDALLGFMVDNKIINYYEQTRFIAAKKEDLDELYFKELMQLAAADSSRRNLEVKLENRVNLPQINRNLLIQREQLAGLSARLAALEISSAPDSLEAVKAYRDSRSASRALQTQAETLKNTTRQQVEAMFAAQRTPDGIETKNLLGRWLEQWLEVEQTLARLEVLNTRKAEFERIYSRFAPWGSKLKRIEREIDVAERAYLENLHSYNQARLHKHNTLMSTNLRVVDAPFFPEKPKPSKRALLVVVAGLAGLLLVFATGLALEFMDNTLHDPIRAAEMTGLELAAAFPRLPHDWQLAKTLDYSFLIRRATGQLIQHLKIALREQGITHRPARVAVLSTRMGEGKTFLTNAIVGQLRAAGEKVLWLRPNSANSASNHLDDRFFSVDHTFFDHKTVADLLGSEHSLDLSAYDYVFTEIPSLLANTFPADYLAATDATLLFARANRTWNRADTRALETLRRVTGRPCQLVLNAVRPDELESALGELPKKRSALRSWAKKMATFNFSRQR